MSQYSEGFPAEFRRRVLQVYEGGFREFLSQFQRSAPSDDPGRSDHQQSKGAEH